MKTVFIGAGNLATRLAIELKKHHFCIEQIYSRTIESANILADKVKSKATNNLSEIIQDADLYIFSVKDDTLSVLLEQFPPNKGFWIHTAGSMPMNVFEGYNNNYGVVYPFQTFSKEREVDFAQIPIFFEANTDENLKRLKDIFSDISSNKFDLSSEKRKFLHLTGVFACNFVNHMYTISQGILEKENIPFEVVLPLIDETANKVHKLKPINAQTGPAVRFDKNIIDKHLSLIDDPQWEEIYELISKDIYKTSKNKNI